LNHAICYYLGNEDIAGHSIACPSIGPGVGCHQLKDALMLFVVDEIDQWPPFFAGSSIPKTSP